jgi:hypothetical protein
MASSDEAIPPNKEQREIVAMLLRLARRCQQIILNPPGKSDAARSFNTSRAAQQIAGIQRELAGFNRTLAELIPKSIQPTLDAAARAAGRQLRDAGLIDDDSPLQGSFALTDSRRAQVLVRRAVDDLLKGVSSTVKQTRQIAADIKALGLDKADIKKLIAGGTIDGVPKATLKQLRDKCRAVADEDGRMWVATKSGGVMSFKPDDYADLVYQTMGAAARDIATRERLAAAGNFYGRFIGSNSARFCTAFVGKVYYFGPGTDPLGLFPHINDLGAQYRDFNTFHVRCTKRLVAFFPKRATPAQLAVATMSPADRARYLGKTAAQSQGAYTAKYIRPKTTAPSRGLNQRHASQNSPPLPAPRRNSTERRPQAVKRRADQPADLTSHDRAQRMQTVLDAWGSDMEVDGQIKPNSVQENHLLDLALVPTDMVNSLRSNGVKVIIGSNGFGDRFPSLANERPRGWATDDTWQDVEGGYQRSSRTAFAGVGRSASISTAIHEVGHAVFDLVVPNLHEQFREAHRRFFGQLPRYFRQGGPGSDASTEEFFCESLAELLKTSPAAFADLYDVRHLKLMQEVIRNAR